jgi:hypothetical protein
MTTVEAKLRPTITISDEAYQAYEKFAARKRISMDQALSGRLDAFADCEAVKGLFFNDAERQELERIAGRNFSSAREVIEAVCRALTVKVGGVEVAIPAEMAARLKSRCQERNFEKWLADLISEKLSEYVNFR